MKFSQEKLNEFAGKFEVVSHHDRNEMVILLIDFVKTVSNIYIKIV